MAAYISFQPSDFFKTLLYTGDGTASRAITGVGFEPGMLWTKIRDMGYGHNLNDAVRGNSQWLTPDNITANQNYPTYVYSLDSDGFTLGNGVSSDGQVNQDTKTFVSYSWKTGTTTGLSGGTITPSAYSINTTSGIGIYQYTGTGSAATIAHGLGATPELIICKKTSGTNGWFVQHGSLGPTKYVMLDLTQESITNSTPWNDTAPTSTLFTLGTGSGVNVSAGTFMAYVFAPKKGYSKFGTYYGNGNVDGTFVYTGFRPAWIVLKISNTTGDWYLFDDKRVGYNVDNNALLANSTVAETTTDYIDILSNGFKLRSTLGVINGSANPIIYMAFAEFPFVSSNSIPTVAR